MVYISYSFVAPKVFAFAFSVAKKFMNEYTLSKIQIYKSDSARWQTAIFSNIDRDQVPAFLGGTLKDPDGNPKLGTKVKKKKTKKKKFILFQNLDKFLDK